MPPERRHWTVAAFAALCYDSVDGKGSGMSGQQKRTHWNWDEYVAWEATQPVRHELIDGQVYAMGGGTAAHDRIANALRVELAVRLRGRHGRPHGPDMKVRTGTGNGRYPDALIDCGRYVPDAFEAQEPVAVFEVLSRSTAWVDQGRKLRDYDATASIRHYVLISQDELRVMVYTRNDNGRLDIRDAILLENLDATLELSGVGISIPLGAIYGGSNIPQSVS
jgi:Uma2 family endonuclease